jgi:hypothetical protein
MKSATGATSSGVGTGVYVTAFVSEAVKLLDSVVLTEFRKVAVGATLLDADKVNVAEWVGTNDKVGWMFVTV